MNTELDSLEVRVQSEAQTASAGLDKLIGSLNQLKSATKGVTGLSRIASGLESLNKALAGLQVNKKGLGALRAELNGLSNIKTHLTATANQINKINAAMKGLEVDDTKLQKLVTSLNSLGQVQKASGLTSVLSALKQIPAITKSLSSQELQKFGLQIRLLVKYLAPLATELEKVSRGFSNFPKNIQRTTRSTLAMAEANQKAARSIDLLGDPVTAVAAKLASYEYILRRIVGFLADSVMSINEYVENVNLFQVSMGEFYDEAFAYAQLVSEKLGVDPSQWLRTQGVFMSIANGFGLSRDQAYALSEGLTELAYDLSSLYNEDVESSALRLQSALAGEIEPIRRLGISITEATLKEFALSKGIDESVESMTEQEKALLRTLKIMEGSAAIGAIGDFARTLESPANALRVLKQELTQLSRAIGSVFIPILVQILPYVQAVVSVLTDLISMLASFVGFEMPEWGSTANWGSGVSSGADAIADSIGNVSDAAGGASKAVKELKNATLGIDELNILAPSGSGAGSGSGGTGAGSNWAADMEIPNIWDQLALSDMSSKAESIKQLIEQNLAQIATVISGASLAVGAVLTFSGVNVPVGLALMAVGAAGLVSVIAENWGYMSTSLSGVLATILGMLGGFFLALGAIMALSGANVPLGIGLMAVGAASLVTAAAVSWDSMGGFVSNALSAITGAVSGALLALGVVLAMSGVNAPLGIALMAVGAAGLASAIAVNWSSMAPEVQSAVSRIAAIVSGAFLALGAILTFSGANPVLGIALMSVGAASLAATVAVNWSSMDSQLRSTITAVTALVGAAFLTLGAIFTFSGANIPLGIGLMAAGAVSLVTAAALNWNTIKNAVTNGLREMGAIVGVSLLALGAILCLSGVALPLGIGLLAAGGVSLGAAVALNWDNLVNSVKNALSKIGQKFSEFVKEWLSVDKWRDLGAKALEGLFSGLSNIGNKIATWGGNLVGGVKNFFGIHSPSTVFRDSVGLYLGQGVAEGLQLAMPDIVKAANGIYAGVQKAMPEYTVSNAQVFLPYDQSGAGVSLLGYSNAYSQSFAQDPNDSTAPVITAVYAAAQQIVRAVEAGGDVYMDGYRVGRRMTRAQNDQNRVYGKTLQNV